MVDKLMRTGIVMSFFLILALFSSCGTNGTSFIDVDHSKQIILVPVDTITPGLDSGLTIDYNS